MRAREDFRRDGLAANFKADPEIMYLACNALPGAIINVGYPAICDSEEEICRSILDISESVDAELAVVGHAKNNHLRTLAKLVNGRMNVSANAWMPISQYFLDKTVKVSVDEAFKGYKNLIDVWKNLSDQPFDFVLTDVTSPEKRMPQEVEKWVDYGLNKGIRNIVLCDTRGIGVPNSIHNIFQKLTDYAGRVEFHPHNDNGFALNNIDICSALGVDTFGTAFYNSGERLTMLDPRELISRGLPFDKESFARFDSLYRERIGDPAYVVNQMYGDGIIVTGTQYRLRNRDKNLQMKFGVTSDTYIASKIFGREIDSEELCKIKNEKFYSLKDVLI